MQKPVRVLFLSSCVRGGGAGWSLYYLLKHLNREIVDPLVVVPDEGIFRRRFAEIGVPAITSEILPERTAQQRFSRSSFLSDNASYALNLVDSLRFIHQLASIIREKSVDLVYCNNMMVKPMGSMASQLAGVPCVLHARNLHERPGKILIYCKTLARIPAVKYVVANSAASAAPYRRSVPDKVRVVHNGIDLDDYRPDTIDGAGFRRDHGFDGEEILVGFTGNLIERKGIKTLIRAAGQVIRHRRNITFVALGHVPVGDPDRYFQECRSLLGRENLGARFRFMGFMDDIRPAVRAFDILALPSLQEPFGRSIVEAMALKTAVIASRVGGIPEIIRDGEEGLLVPPGDHSALARAILRLADDPDLRGRLSGAAHARVRSEFDVALLSGRIEELLIEAAQHRR